MQLALSNPPPKTVAMALENPLEDEKIQKTAADKDEASLPVAMLKRQSVSDAADNHTMTQMTEKEKAWGIMELYFGCRNADVDYIYRDEISKAHISGALTEVHVALSRQSGQPKACKWWYSNHVA